MTESKIKGRRRLPSLHKRQGPIVDVFDLFYTIRHVVVVFGSLYSNKCVDGTCVCLLVLLGLD